MSKINSYAIFLNLALYSPTIELHQSHIKQIKKKNQDSRILAIVCDGKFGGCSVNPFGSPTICNFCIKRARYVVKQENIGFVYLSSFDLPESKSSFSENRLFWAGSMSSVASHTRVESVRDLNRVWYFIYKRLFKASRRTYFSVANIIQQYQINHLYLYNGRFSCAKAAKEAARALMINFSVYDVRRSVNPYVHHNKDLHNVFECFDRAKTMYSKNPEISRQEAIKYFNSRGKSSLFGASYTTKMKVGEVGNIDNSKKIITIYTSSDDEYRFLGQDWGIQQQAISQFKEIEYICKNLDLHNWQIVIRIHPNQTGVRTNSLRKIKLLNQLSNVTVCEPDSPIDTYELLDISDLIVCFASSISLEAAYRKKTIIQIGPSPYSIIDIGYIVSNGKEAVNFINSWQDGFYSIPSKDNINAFVYANYLLNYKDDLPAFSKIGPYYMVDGKKVPLNTFGRLLQMPEKFIIPLSKSENIFSYAFLRKCWSYLLSIIQGRFYTVK